MNRVVLNRFIRRCLCAFLLLSLMGCSKLTLENYDQLKVGMSYEEVTGLIGEPSGCSEALGTRSCQWGNDKKNIKVTFFGSRATLFSAEGLN